MIQIESITLREIRLTLKEPFTISSGTMSDRRILLVEVRDATGAVAWGECTAGETPNYSPEIVDTAWIVVRDHLAPRVLDVPFEHPRDVHPALERDIRGHNMAKAAVEMASWALAAEMEQVPLSKLLGGTRTQIATGISIGIQPGPEALAGKAEFEYARGYKKIKCKIKPGMDIDYIRAVRNRLGPEAPIMADANNAYTMGDLETLKELDGFNLVMIEQPLAWDDVVRHAELQPHLKTPICLDESITGLAKAEDMIKLKSGRIVNIKPARVGGFRESIAIHDLCAANDIPVWCGGMLETGIGRAHNVALASLPNFTIPGDISPSDRYWARDIVDPEWTMNADGMVTVPLDRPGIGVDVDRELIESITVRKEELSASPV